MKIVHICPTATGAPWMVALMREQKRLGHDVAAIVTGLDGSIADELGRDGIPCYAGPVSLLSVRGMTAKASAVLQLVTLLRRLKPDVVHSHVLDAVVAGRIASWLADTPCHLGGNVAPISIESDLLRPLEIGTAFADTTTIASCSHTRDLLVQHGIPPDRVELIYYAVDQSGHDPAKADGARVRRELGIPDDTPIVGKMAYFYPAANSALFRQWDGRGLKGHDVLVRAVPHVLRSVPNAKFVLVGRGWGPKGDETERRIRELTAQLGVTDSVVFAGERRDVPDTLAMFDVSVQCSLTDNPAGTVESLLMERPLVVSDIRGFADTVRHEETGLVVPVDDPEALARAIVRLLQNPDLGRRLGENGRRLMLERFCLARTVADVEALLQRTASAHRRGYRLSRSIARLFAAPFVLLPIAEAVKRHQEAGSLPRRAVRRLRGRVNSEPTSAESTTTS